MAAIDNINAAIANVTANIAAITASPQPSYSVQGVSLSFSEYLAQLVDQLEKLQQAAIYLGQPYELVTQAVS